VYAGATEGVAKAWITNIAHRENTATAIGFYTSCESICTLIASFVAGIIWSQFGSFYTFAITATIAIMACLYLVLTIRSD
jgi:predicted MFS family arabinose efflux permease